MYEVVQLFRCLDRRFLIVVCVQAQQCMSNCRGGRFGGTAREPGSLVFHRWHIFGARMDIFYIFCSKLGEWIIQEEQIALAWRGEANGDVQGRGRRYRSESIFHTEFYIKLETESGKGDIWPGGFSILVLFSFYTIPYKITQVRFGKPSSQTLRFRSSWRR